MQEQPPSLLKCVDSVSTNITEEKKIKQDEIVKRRDGTVLVNIQVACQKAVYADNE